MAAKPKTKLKKKKEKWMPKGIYIYLFLFSLSVLLYANTIGHDYTLDDAILISENTFTKQGWKGIRDIFSHDTFFGFFNQEGKDKLVSGGRYRPLTHAMFAIEYSLFGEVSTWGHLLNIFWYGFLCCSIYFVLLSLFRNKKDPAFNVLFAVFLTSLLFVVHPVHSEVVANIKGRDEICALLASIWSLYFMLIGWKQKRLLWSGIGIILLLAGILSKENAISFVLIIPLASFMFKKSRIGFFPWIILPVLLTTGIYLIARFSVLGWGLPNESSMELMNNPFLIWEGNAYRSMDFLEKWPLIISGLGRGLKLLFFPHPLTHDYYPRQFPVVSLFHWKVLISITFIGLLLFIGFRLRKKQPLISFSILYYFVTIFLTTNILFPIGTHFSERFLFMPSLGFCLVIGFLTSSLLKWKHKILPIGILTAIVLVFSIKTLSRNLVWKDNFTLFTTDVRTSFNSAKAQNAAGGALITRAQTQTDSTEKTKMILKSIDHLDQAISIHPTYKNAFLLRGNAYFYLKEYEKAIQNYDQALIVAPGYQEAKFNRAISYRDFGRYYGEKFGDLTKAIQYLELALQELSDDFEANRLMAIAYGNKGNTDQAIHFFEKALSINQQDAWTFYNLGVAYLNMGDTIRGNDNLRKAKEINPEIRIR